MDKQVCSFSTRTGLHIGYLEVPVVEGKRPEIVKQGKRIFRHYRGATLGQPAEYRQVLGEFVEIPDVA